MRLVRSAMAVKHLRLQPKPARISGPRRGAEARPATEHNTTFTCEASTRPSVAVQMCGVTTSSGLVLRAHRDLGLAVRIQRDRDHDRPAADLAVLDVLLVTGGAVDRSEEHTSELQSLMRISYAVFCLKKK